MIVMSAACADMQGGREPDGGADPDVAATPDAAPSPDAAVTPDARDPRDAPAVPIPPALPDARAVADAVADAADVVLPPLRPNELATATRICGTSVLAMIASPNGYAVVWGEHTSPRQNALRFALLRGGDGQVVTTSTIATGEGGGFCVSRDSLARAGNSDSRQRYAVAWRRLSATGDASTLETALLDVNGAVLAVGPAEPSHIVGVRPGPDDVSVYESLGTVYVAYAALDRGRYVLRRVEHDFDAALTPGIRGVATLATASSLPLDATPDSPPVLGTMNGVDLAVAYNPSPSSGQLRLRMFSIRGDFGPATMLETGLPNLRPLDVYYSSGGYTVIYAAGFRAQSVQSVTIGVAPPYAARTIARDAAWYGLDATYDHDRLVNDVWASHGGEGRHNHVVLVAPAMEANPLRCEALRLAGDDPHFYFVAHARRASRDQLVLGVGQLPAEGREVLMYRAIPDGGTVCR